MSALPDGAAEIYETRLEDARTGETCAQLLFGDLEDAKDYLEAYALIRFGANTDVWKPQGRESQSAWVMHYRDVDVRGVIRGRAIHADADPVIEAAREIHAETRVETI